MNLSPVIDENGVPTGEALLTGVDGVTNRFDSKYLALGFAVTLVQDLATFKAFLRIAGDYARKIKTNNDFPGYLYFLRETLRETTTTGIFAGFNLNFCFVLSDINEDTVLTAVAAGQDQDQGPGTPPSL